MSNFAAPDPSFLWMRPRTIVVRLIVPFLLAAGIAFSLRGVLQVYSIPSASMSPTLRSGDHVVVIPYGTLLTRENPLPGDVVVFRGTGGEYFIKRIIGRAGDHLEISGGSVSVNGVRLHEPYAAGRLRREELRSQIVAPRSFFLLGDNRDDSLDSRVWGPVPDEWIVGRARWIFWSAESGSVASSPAHASSRRDGASPDRATIRWGRILSSIR